MELEKLLSSIQERIPYNQFRALLKKVELPPSNGWDNTFKKIRQEVESEAENIEEKIEKLLLAYREHLLVGEKAVKFFKIKPSLIQSLLNQAEGLKYDECPFTQAFPFFLDDENSNNVHPSNLYFIKKLKHTNGLALIFFSKKYFQEKQSLDVSTINDSLTREYFDQFQEVYGLKQNIKQFADIVFINKKENLVEYRLDIRNFSRDERKKGFGLIHKKFVNLFPSIDFSERTFSALNFYPLLNKFYESSEGRVCELGFTTDEGAIKKDRMRFKNTDLRYETFHHAGRKAVTLITPYKIGVVWEKENYVDENIELIIPGTISLLTQSQFPVIDEVILTGCMNLNDCENVKNKILRFLR